MSHRHFCDYAGHDWQCGGAALRGSETEPSLCMCCDHGVPMEEGDHSRCTIELLACPPHRESQASADGEGADNVPQGDGHSETTKRRLKIPLQHKLWRALRRASRHGFVGTCVWCGHGYKRFSHEIQEAHLTDCVEYQRAKRSPSPEFWGQKLKEAKTGTDDGLLPRCLCNVGPAKSLKTPAGQKGSPQEGS
jgi:hypothetical protein